MRNSSNNWAAVVRHSYLDTDLLENQNYHKPSTPRSFGPYTVVRRIGEGGAGEVFLATDEQGAPVALKVPNVAAWNSEHLMLRFLREGRAAALLDHPGVLPLLAVGTSAIPYLAFGYCDGPNLRDWLAARTEELSIDTVCEWMEMLSDAVAHAHQTGIVHRDIKPSNILLSPDTNVSQGYRPMLADFGLARISVSNEDPTDTGTLLGTPEYMAPEQTRGSASQIGPASDVWSLGVLMYRLLTGRLPFLGLTRADTLLIAITEEPVAARRLRRDLTPELEAIVCHCLEKRPRNRYADARELCADLRRYRHGQRTIARPLGNFGAAMRWMQQRPVIAVLLIMTTLGIAGILAGLSLHQRFLHQTLELAERRREQAEELSQQLAQREHSLRQFAHHNSMALASRIARSGNNPERVHSLLDQYSPQKEEDVRGFAWRLLYAPWVASDVRLTLPTVDSTAMAIIPGTESVLVVGVDGFVGIVSSLTGEVLRQLKASVTDLFCVAVSPNGRYGAAAGTDGNVGIWDLSNGQLLTSWHGSKEAIHSLLFINDDQIIVGGRERQFHRFRVPEGTFIDSSDNFDSVVVPGILLSGAARLSIGLIDEYGVPDLAVCDLSGKVLCRRSAKEHHIFCGAMSPTGLEGVTGGRDGKIRRWKTDDLSDLGSIGVHSAPVRALAYSPDGRLLASGGDDGVVNIWDIETNRIKFRFCGFDGPIRAAGFSSSTTVVAVGKYGRFQSWSLTKRADSLFASELPVETVVAGTFHPDGKTVSLVFANGQIGRWSVSDGRRLNLTQVQIEGSENARSIQCSPAGDMFAVVQPDHVDLIRTQNGTIVASLNIPKIDPRSFQFDEQGQRFFAAATSIGWWNHAGQLQQEIQELPAEGVVNPIFGAAESMLYLRTNNTGYSFEWRRNHEVFRFPTIVDPKLYRSHSMAADGTAAAWGLSFHVALHHNRSYREFQFPAKHPVRTAFSRDGKTLLAANEKLISLYDLITEQEIAIFEEFIGEIGWIDFAPQDQLFAIASNTLSGPQLRFWHAPTPARSRN